MWDENLVKDKMAILIPTRNRPFLIFDLLVFILTSNLNIDLYIADSSSVENRVLLRKILSEIKKMDKNNILKINVIYFEDRPDVGLFYRKIIHAVKLIQHEYVFLLPDDDFPNFCIWGDVLKVFENDDSVSIVSSNYCNILEEKDAGKIEYKFTTAYRGRSQMEDSIYDRLKNYSECPQNFFYSVYRRETLYEAICVHAIDPPHPTSQEHRFALLNLVGGKRQHLPSHGMILRNSSENQRLVEVEAGITHSKEVMAQYKGDFSVKLFDGVSSMLNRLGRQEDFDSASILQIGEAIIDAHVQGDQENPDGSGLKIYTGFPGNEILKSSQEKFKINSKEMGRIFKNIVMCIEGRKKYKPLYDDRIDVQEIPVKEIYID
tara:strand:+ start:720 stop:1847 length:1128 start_codon:yes stop_codon:yes gene_type:complete